MSRAAVCAGTRREMTEANNSKYPYHIGDLPKGTVVAIPEEFYEINGVICETEQFGCEGLRVTGGQMLYPSSATQCRVMKQCEQSAELYANK
jgi:hypothetical protein